MVYCLLCLVSIVNYVLQVLWHISLRLKLFFKFLRYWCTQIINTITWMWRQVFFVAFWAIFVVVTTIGIHNLTRSLHPPLFQGVLSPERDTAADVPSFSLKEKKSLMYVIKHKSKISSLPKLPTKSLFLLKNSKN